MKTPGLDLRGIVMGWTLFTTTFLWTPTMRMLLKPEVSQWSVFGLSGSGTEGAFWIFPLGAALALLLFYLEGRGRLRPAVHGLLLAWHLPLTAGLIWGAASLGPEASFVGAAWGWEVPFAILAVPFVVLSGLTVVWIAREARSGSAVDATGWTDVDWRPLAGAVVLLPAAAVLFGLGGAGYDGWVKLAIAATVTQWVLLTIGLNGRASEETVTGGRSRLRTRSPGQPG